MDLGQVVLVLSGLTALAGGIYAIIRSRAESKRDDVKAEAEARAKVAADTREAFEQNMELAQYVDARIAAALKEPLETIAKLRTDINELRERARTKDSIVRRFFQRLFHWDQTGRKGPMPVPSEEEMTVLDIIDIQADTKTALEIQEARDQLVSEERIAP